MKSVLLTGAAGDIGRTFYQAARGRYRFVLTDRVEPGFVVDPTDRFEIADLSVPGAADPLVEAADVIVHLAAESDETKDFHDLLPANVLAATYLLEAAARARVSRFVFASSLHAVHGYPPDHCVRPEEPVRPVNHYGATKCYGEALCACHAYRDGLSTVVLRIGDFEPCGSGLIADAYDCSAWISPRDIVQLIIRAIETEGIGFFIAHGVSDNRIQRLDLAETRRVLGYQPEDDGFEVFPEEAKRPSSR
ncbi:MAG: NAD(P)-dependent oxidoreductase [Xanthomonadales bacterium]|nr:NAD(P)-dependent oxidoreductase [Xanthomonadales bacterium]